MEVDDSVAEGLRRMGVSEEDIAKAQGRGAPVHADYEVHADCWDSVMLFLRCESQWIHVVQLVPKVSGLGMTVVSKVVRQGLNMVAVESVARMSGMRRSRWPALLDDVLVMQKAVLDADNERDTG